MVTWEKVASYHNTRWDIDPCHIIKGIPSLEAHCCLTRDSRLAVKFLDGSHYRSWTQSYLFMFLSTDSVGGFNSSSMLSWGLMLNPNWVKKNLQGGWPGAVWVGLGYSSTTDVSIVSEVDFHFCFFRNLESFMYWIFILLYCLPLRNFHLEIFLLNVISKARVIYLLIKLIKDCFL